jgi:predicted DNA-binding protein YlxM (UPF0122 family)
LTVINFWCNINYCKGICLVMISVAIGFEGEVHMLEKTTHINLLYDFYQNLLTEKQKNYMELYYHDDLSLSEIAEQYSVSRQAVFENLKRAEHLLEQYEDQLQLLYKYNQRQSIFDQLLGLLEHESEVEFDTIRKLVTALKNVD